MLRNPTIVSIVLVSAGCAASYVGNEAIYAQPEGGAEGRACLADGSCNDGLTCDLETDTCMFVGAEVEEQELAQPQSVGHGTMQPVFIYHAGGDIFNDLRDVVPNVDGGGYLAIENDGSSSWIVRVDPVGDESWRAEVGFWATAMAVADVGVYVSGRKYRPIRGPRRHGAHLALISPTGEVLWETQPPPPDEDPNSTETLSDPTDEWEFQLWELVVTPDNQAIAMGVGWKEAHGLLGHLRVNAQGEIVWHRYLATYGYSSTFYPDQVEPYLTLANGCLRSVGAIETETSNCEVLCVRLDASTGELLGRYTPDAHTPSQEPRNWEYRSAIVNPVNNHLAISFGTRNGEERIVVLNEELEEIVELAPPIGTWTGIAWGADNQLFLADWFERHPWWGQIDVGGDAPPEHTVLWHLGVWDKSALTVVNGEAYVATPELGPGSSPYSFDSSETYCAVRSFSHPADMWYEYAGDFGASEPVLAPLADGFLFAMDTPRGPVLLRFNTAGE